LPPRRGLLSEIISFSRLLSTFPEVFLCYIDVWFLTLQKKKNKKVVGVAAGEALASQFELDFSFIACMASSALGLVWYLDSGTSFHMMGDKEFFSDLEERDMKMHIEMGDDG
jgi:hypothetical protein